MKNQSIAILLALFLGGLGIHKFYLGKVGQGFLYLIFFWTFIPALAGFVDFIRLCVMRGDDFQKNYSR